MWQGWGQPLAQPQPLSHLGKVWWAAGGRGSGAGHRVPGHSRAKELPAQRMAWGDGAAMSLAGEDPHPLPGVWGLAMAPITASVARVAFRGSDSNH